MPSPPGTTLDAPATPEAPSAAIVAALSDRRFALRVPAERSVRVWNRFHLLKATLQDLSLSGCRLICREPVNSSATLWLWLPGGLGGWLWHPVRGDVVWAESVSGEPTGVCQAAVRFRPLFPGTTPRIQRALEALVADDPKRRERSERVAYERRVIARGQGRPRVLIGQDLSTTGMRIANGEGLEVGAEFQLALHAGGALPPVVVTARVVRLDGDAAGLEFVGIDSAFQDQLRKLVGEHPRLIGSDGQRAFVSEIVSADCGD